MHYFQFNIGDYASHTRHLSPMEDLAYRRLLDLYYLKDGEVYGDEAEVARQVGLRDYVQEVKQVLQDFFCLDEDDRWSHARCDAEIAHFRQKSEKASNAGKASAQRRSNVRSTGVQPTNNQQPITNNQEPVLSSNEDMSSDDDRVSVKDIVEAWNELAEVRGLAKVVRVTDSRRKQIQARIKEYEPDDWSKALTAIYKSKFLCGENDRGWKADFDFLLQPKSFVKLVEGAYDR
jgi:uncharacterized protein YdaU (DUF1376 family)